MKPGSGYTSSRVRGVERQAEASDRNPPWQGRPARPLAPRNGHHRAIAVDQITQGAAGTVKLIYWTGTGWKVATDPADDSVIEVEATACWLNTGETIEIDTVVIIQHMDDGMFEIITAACDVFDWTLET